VAWIVLLVGSALAVPVYGITVVWERQLDDVVDDELRREADKLRQFAKTSRDPVTGQPFPDAASLLTAFMTVNQPSQDETFFSIVDGRADRRSSHQPPARLDRDAAVVARLARPPGTEMGLLRSPAGRVRYGVIPVRVAGDSRDVRLVVLEFQDRQLREERRVRTLLLTSGAGALVAAALAGWVVAGRILAPIRLVRQTAEQIGESDLTRRLKVPGKDDVAALAHTFNHMLDRLENAFTTQRRFLDDVAHELRTPITVIRGHLELMDDREEEREATRALVVDELDRMSRIVRDLLLLAKAERPDFLTVGETNLTDLVVDVVAKARALGDRHWKVAAVSEATVLVDGQRLTQALIQLAANAVRHTKDGDPVELGSRTADGRVLLWVGDSGPGVRPEDRERIFERFARADRVVSPDASCPGIGLGLAIVREIATAHGGTTRVEDAQGGGARFVMDLPAHFPARRGHDEPDTHSGGRGPGRRVRGTGPAQPWLRHLRRR
jgi:signal transduction histidine kinase